LEVAIISPTNARVGYTYSDRRKRGIWNERNGL
jgi:hypothetical protein